MKPRILLSAARLSFPLATALAALFNLAAPSAQAATYYWDNNTTTAGFGTAGGTWSSAGGIRWNNDSLGGTVGSPNTLGTTITTATTDTLNFGTNVTGGGLAAGTITVSGTVNSGNMTFGNQSGNIIFTGTLGTAKVNFASTATINTGGNTITFDNVSLNGASSLTYTGGGVLQINTNNSNLTGDFFVLNGTLRFGNPSSGSGANGLGGASGPKITLGNTSGTTAATLEIANTFTIANDIEIRAGSSGLKTLGLNGAIGATYSGAITANDNLRVLNDVSGTNSAVSVTGTGSSIAVNKTVTWSLAAGVINDTGTWSGQGAFSYSGSAVGDITVSGAKTYSGGATLGSMSSTGDLVVNASSTGSANAPTNGPFGTGTLSIGATRIRAKTFDRTIHNSITFTSAPTFTTDAAETSVIFLGDASLGATRTFTVDTGSTVAGKYVEFRGQISGSTFGITKAGTGTLLLSGNNIYTGNTTVSAGTLNITGIYSGGGALTMGNSATKTVTNVSNNMTLSTVTGGNIANSFAVYNQTAGTVTSVGNATTPTAVANNGGYGYLNLTGGTYSQTANRFSVTNSTSGAGGAGVVYVGGTGTLDLTGTTSTIIGYTGMPASLTVGPGGSVDRSTGTGNFWLTVNANAYGVLNVAGGDFNTAGSAIKVGNTNGGPQTGFVNLAKGTLTLGLNGSNSLSSAGGSALYSNYAGGTLKAANNLTAVVPVTNANLTSISTIFGAITNNNNANTAFNTQIGTTSNFTGGLTVDTNTFDVNYTSALLGATGNGVKQANITVTGGSGYIGAPMVQFTGGTLATNGTPAAGYAVINATTGAVTGIVITSPGEYTVNPTSVDLTGGGGTGASVALSALTANPTDTGLTKINTGNLSLTGANTYSGGTFIKNGSITLTGGNDRLLTTSSVVLGDTGTTGKLILGDSAAARNQILGGLTTTGLGGSVVGAHSVTDSVLTLNIASGTNIFGGTLGGGGTNEDKIALIKDGTGTLQLNGANSYTGATTVNGGILSINNYAGLDNTSGITVAGGTSILQFRVVGTGATADTINKNLSLHGTLRTAGGTATDTLALTWDGDITLAGNGTINNHGNGSIDVNGQVDLGAHTLTFQADQTGSRIDGNIIGAGGLIKTGAQPLTITGANSFTGSTNISTGTLVLGSTGALGTTPGVDGTSGITIGGASAATLSSTLDGIIIAAPITTANTGVTSTIAFSRNTATAGSIALNGAIGGNGNVTLTTPNVSSGGNIQTINLGAAGTYAGNTTITTGNSNNSLTIKNTSGVSNALPVGTVLSLTGGTGSGSGRSVTYDLGGQDQTLAGLQNTLAADRYQIVTNSGTLAVLTINNSDNFSFGGVFPGLDPGTGQITGAIALTKSGAGTFSLAAGIGNTFTGATKVLDGILSIEHATSLQNSAFDTAGSVTGTLGDGLRTTVTTLTLGGLSGNQDFASRFTTTSGGYTGLTALTLNPGTDVTHSYAADIGDGVGGMTLTKSGAGTQTLTGANTYTGTTDVNTGILAINGVQSAATGNVTVASTATLKGTGTVGGATTIQSGGIHNAGDHSATDSVGTQTFSSNLTYASGSIFAWDLNANLDGDISDGDTGSAGTDYDRVVAGGSISIASDAIFRVIMGSSVDFADTFWNSNQEWNDIFGTVTGGWAADTAVAVNTYNFGNNTYAVYDPTTEGSFTITGTSLTWTAVPEPTSALVGLLIGAGLLRRRRRNVGC